MTKANDQMREKAFKIIQTMHQANGFCSGYCDDNASVIEQALLEAKAEGRAECENNHVIKTVTKCEHGTEVCFKCMNKEREKAIRECADLIKQPCPHYSTPCGDCRHCHLTKAAMRILRILPSRGKEGAK